MCPLRSRVLRLTEASFRGRILRRRHHGTRLSRRQTIVTEWPSWTWCRTWWNHSWHNHLKSALSCLHSSAHSCGVQISSHFANSELERCFWMLPIGINRAASTAAFDGWTTSSLFSEHKGNGQATQQLKYCTWIKMFHHVTHFQASFRTNNYCLNSEITAEAHTADLTLHRLMVYFLEKHRSTFMTKGNTHSVF